MTTTITNTNRTTVVIANKTFSLVNYGNILQDSTSSFTVTPWLDTKLFPIIQVTASLDSQCAYVYWGLSHDERPGTKAFVDPIHVTRGTVELDSRARWARIACSGAVEGDELSYLLKPAPTGIKLVDDDGTLVSVAKGDSDNALLTVYRDTVGILGNTSDNTDDNGINRAGGLHTILTSSGGDPLASLDDDTLAVAPADGSGSYYDSTNIAAVENVSIGDPRSKILDVFGEQYPNKATLEINSTNYRVKLSSFSPNLNNVQVSDIRLSNNITDTGGQVTPINDTEFSVDADNNCIYIPAEPLEIQDHQVADEGGHETYIINFVQSVYNNNVNNSTIPYYVEVHTCPHKSYTTHNALAVVPTSHTGRVQAGTDISGYEKLYPAYLSGKTLDTCATALYYSLADASGMIIGSTMSATDSSNAVCVHLVDHCGNPHDASNPIPIAFAGDSVKGYTVGTNIGDDLLKLIDISSKDFSANPFNIDSLHLANETPTPVWYKIYDADPGFKTLFDNLDSGCGDKYDMIKSALKLNMAVPPLVTRDVFFNKGLTFYNGVLSRASNLHGYDASGDGFLYSDDQTFISINYASILRDNEQLLDSLQYRNVPDSMEFGGDAELTNGDFTLKFWTHPLRDNGTDISVILVPITASDFSSNYPAADGHITVSGANIVGTNADNCYSLFSSVDGENRFPTPPIVFGLRDVGKADYSFNLLVEHQGDDSGTDTALTVRCTGTSVTIISP